MGLRDLIRRRERESAIPPGTLEAVERELEEASQRGDELRDRGGDRSGGGGEASEGRHAGVLLPGADAAELGEMLGGALRSGYPQVSDSSHRVGPGSGLTEEILGLLRAAGIGVGEPERPERSDPDL